jgi:Asp-tRNA(Asn)/Glu-tRNA(Gln) amidotransferase A subunit family amidase
MGMPISIKDFLSVEGMPTRVGSRLECRLRPGLVRRD